jgi:Flp pilus assembly protein TadG
MKKSRGQSTVEFALVLPLFALVFFAFVEFGHLFYVKVTLQHALSEAGRYMVTGQNNPVTPEGREEEIRARFCNNLIGTGIPCPEIGSDFKFTYGGCSDADADGYCDDAGKADAMVTVTATFEKPVFTALFAQFFTGGKANFTVSTTWKNEPFPTT